MDKRIKQTKLSFRRRKVKLLRKLWMIRQTRKDRIRYKEGELRLCIFNFFVCFRLLSSKSGTKNNSTIEY